MVAKGHLQRQWIITVVADELGDTPTVGGWLRKYTSMPFEIVTCKSRWCWKPSLM